MPFSDTPGVGAAEWTAFFEVILKPAVEDAGLGYSCRRSEVPSGSVIRGIVQDLECSDIVIADLTGQKANVFYELGVRHALRNGTLLLARSKEDAPFDLQSYAFHVYDVSTAEDADRLRAIVARFVAAHESDPNRPDNPVADYGGAAPSAGVRTASARTGTSLSETSSLDLSATTSAPEDIGFRHAQAGDVGLITRTCRRTMGSLLPAIRERQGSLLSVWQQTGRASIPIPDIYNTARPAVESLEELVAPLEIYALSASRCDGAMRPLLSCAGELATLTEQANGGVRWISGAPGILGWRICALLGALALHEERYAAARSLFEQPLEITDLSGRATFVPWAQREHLFHPEGFAKRVDVLGRYAGGLFERTVHLHELFPDPASYKRSLVELLLLVELHSAADTGPGKRVQYPTYLHVEGASSFQRRFVDRLAADSGYLEKACSVLGETPDAFRRAYGERAERINSTLPEGRAVSGGAYWPVRLGG